MDLKKEIKLADLIPKRSAFKRSGKPVSAPKRQTMPPELVGLKIEAGSLSAAQIVNNGSKKLVRIAQAPLGQGIVNAGEVRDPAALSSALSDFFRTNDLPRRGIRLGLANSRVGVRMIEISGVEDAQQLENAIGFRAHEILSVPIDEAVVDYHLLESIVDDAGTTTHRILLVVAYRDSIDRYLAATRGAELELAGIDLEAFALLRAAAPAAGGESEPTAAVAAISIDRDLTTLAISNGSVCHLTRVLEWGEANIDTAFVRALRVTAAQAEELRERLSLASDVEGRDSGGAPPSAQLREIVGRELQTLVRELQSSFRFYKSQPDALPVGELLISGSLADVPGFAKTLASHLGSSVGTADPFARVEFAEGFERPNKVGGLAVAVGLGIED
jgi:type IV pilus assembly protein PilM